MAEAVANLRTLFPEGDVDLIDLMVEEDRRGTIGWDTIGKGPQTEADVFATSYRQITQWYIAAYGSTNARIIADLFRRFEPVADLFTRFVLKSEKVVSKPLGAKLTGQVARGSAEAFIRPLTLASFANASYLHQPTSTGTYNLLPTTTGEETATDGEQAWLIMGFIEPIAKDLIPYDEIQYTINDKLGTRRPKYPYIAFSAQSPSNLKIYELTTPEFVQPSQTLDIDVTVRVANVQFGLFPLGIEIIKATSTRAAGPIS